MDSYAFKNPWDQLGMHHVLLQVYLPQQWQQVMVVYLQETDRLLATCIWIYILPIKTNLGLSEVVGSPSTRTCMQPSYWLIQQWVSSSSLLWLSVVGGLPLDKSGRDDRLLASLLLVCTVSHDSLSDFRLMRAQLVEHINMVGCGEIWMSKDVCTLKQTFTFLLSWVDINGDCGAFWKTSWSQVNSWIF